MTDTNDTTIPKKRGRPSIGEAALSGADRMRRARAKKIGKKQVEIYLSPAAELYVTRNKKEGETWSDTVNRLLVTINVTSYNNC